MAPSFLSWAKALSTSLRSSPERVANVPVFCRMNPESGSFSGYYPAVETAELRAEVRSDLDDGASVALPWEGVTLVVNLLHGLLGRAVILEFHDIDVLVGFQDEVYAAVAGLVFGFDVEAAEGCHDEHDILEPVFRILGNLVEFGACKEGLEPLHEAFGVAGLYVGNEFADFEC